MTQPRSTLVSLDDTPWYHVVSRCVRREYLCGFDHHSGRNFEHRRGWIVERLQQLAAVFAIDVAAYAVMSNHVHLVVRLDAERAHTWDRDEVLRRWTQLFTGPELVQRYRADPEGLCAAELARVDLWVTTYRERLMDLSWFMRMLNEPIARQANAEDGVTGRFWEGRFKSQALLDEQAVLTAMAYVDLNPIRAKMAETPESSDYTSVAERIAGLREERDASVYSPRNHLDTHFDRRHFRTPTFLERRPPPPVAFPQTRFHGRSHPHGATAHHPRLARRHPLVPRRLALCPARVPVRRGSPHRPQFRTPARLDR